MSRGAINTYMSLCKSLSYAYLVNKVRIPVRLPWAPYLGKMLLCPSQAAKAHRQKYLWKHQSYTPRRADSLAKRARARLVCTCRGRATDATQQCGAASITSCACDLLRPAKMVEILLPSSPTWSQGPQWIVRHVPFRPVR